jgi:segregation and condensation protein A
VDRLIEADLFDLVQAFQKIVNRFSPSRQVHLSVERISIRDRMMEIMVRFESRMLIELDDLFFQYGTKSDLIITFLALLELTKQAMIRIYQHDETGLIRLIRL